MKVAVYGRTIATEGLRDFIAHFTSCLEKHEMEYVAIPQYARFLKSKLQLDLPQSDELNEIDILISLGGDGTVLDTLSIVKDSGLAVLGVNLGRFGFLANTTMDDIESTIIQLKKGEYSIEGRSVIKVETEIDEIQDFPYALNDFVVQKRDSSAMITVDTHLDGEFLNSYWADGLIVSSPTGSSGYSLSCGGPLLFPGSQSFVVTPIAAHNLTVRPAVIPDDKILELQITGRSNTVLVSLDSRSYKVSADTQFRVKKGEFYFNMVRLKGSSYMDTIRTKLMWGVDTRNR